MTASVGPAVTITTCAQDATTGDLTVTYQATFNLGGGQSQVQTFTDVIPAYQLPMYLELITSVILPSQYCVPNTPPPTNADVGRLWAAVRSIIQAPKPAPPAPTTYSPPPITA